MTPGEQKLTALLKKAQALGNLDAAEGGRRRMLPLVIEALGVKMSLGMDIKMMIQSMYQAGFNSGDRIKDEE